MSAKGPDGSATTEDDKTGSTPRRAVATSKSKSVERVLRLALDTVEEFVLEWKIGLKVHRLLKIPGALRSLGSGARRVAVASLALLALLVGSTAIIHIAPDWFSALTWPDGGQTVALPRVALYLSLVGWAFSGAIILTGASHWNLGVLVAAGLVQLFAVVFTAFAGGKAYWLAAPSWLLPLFAATSPAAARTRTARAIATVLLCALATWHTYLLTPLSAGGRPPGALAETGGLC